MKSIILFISAVVAVFMLRNAMDAGSEFANWVAFIAGVVYVTWVVRMIIRVQ